jgi:hypothetical protein
VAEDPTEKEGEDHPHAHTAFNKPLTP